ncbi:MAG: F0F1 ATP synthase subunit A [Candidatus Liptonbacteria bacterium]|nr:F0F1 ATP synthase subunit A [Candidatus Liptonbacteria bacterium]
MESGLHIQLAAEKVGTLFGIPVTNTLVTTWVVMGLLLILGIAIKSKVSIVPGKLQNAVEMFIEYVFGYVEGLLDSRELALRYFPLIATIFIFILAGNLFDFIPFIGSFGIYHGGEFVPVLHPVNADLNSTLALAIISFLVIEFSGILTLGFFKYGSKFVNFKGGIMEFIVGLIEIIGNLARLISLSFRLFGAIFAGEVLLLVIGMFVPLLLPVPLMAFEIFIGILQAGIFAVLTLAFIKIAIAEPHGHGATAGEHKLAH